MELISNSKEALAYYEKAKEVMKDVKGYPRTAATIYFQIALTQLSINQIAEAENNVAHFEKIVEQELLPLDPKIMEAGRIWFLKARLFKAKNQYVEALTAINKNIEFEQLLSHKLNVASFIVKAEILNDMQNYQGALDIATLLFNEYVDIKNMTIRARILVQLARAENGILNGNKYLEYAQKAEQLLKTSTRDASKDQYLAECYMALGAAYITSGNHDLGTSYHILARKIYDNKYKI